MARNNKDRHHRPLVPAHPDAPLVGRLEDDWKAIEARPVPPVEPARNAAQLALEAEELRRYAEQEKIKKIFQDAPAQLEVARQKGRDDLDEWCRQNAAKAKRDENERIENDLARLAGSPIPNRSPSK
jgi:hypothetical protein